MQIQNNTVLVTGGSSGIGLAISKALLEAGNQVIICGRDKARLNNAKEKLPALHTYACDVSKRDERVKLFDWITRNYSPINLLINNAGVERETDFTKGAPELIDGESEIDINLKASIELSGLFVPYFTRSRDECAIVSVTSGLAFIPLMSYPVYCATKAALHSFSMSLRSQLAHSNVRVFEIIPPLVHTNLHREEQSRHRAEVQGIAPEKVAERLIRALQKNEYEVSIGQARDLKYASRIAPHFFHRLLNKLATK
ncbi:SDR family oxidoreductase [Blastomonas sp.]|uniref:SDR family oxidoreductase n=1 Tax=Blastomonas sp. TaxID=1909299 RepID=UPI0035943BF8